MSREDEPKYQHGIAVIRRELAGGAQLVMICEEDRNMIELTLEQARYTVNELRNFIAEAEVAPKWELVEQVTSGLIGRRVRQHSNSEPFTVVAVGPHNFVSFATVPFFVEVKR